ncbi:hypothetical protein [Staphylococcus pseudoxylosus]|uniref:hypothetical protein n=1 Tax=Staphylococcus pseudoxylosus TaxID=2282419 RepID=UPI002DB5A94C|nr:hypothetical protein [Staphylococcus pseudoxylosus]MEB7753278.1 hypothetical protein [Staphylococcus pseudoxylosus]
MNEDKQNEIEKAVLQSRLSEEIQRGVNLQIQLEQACRELEAYKTQQEYVNE